MLSQHDACLNNMVLASLWIINSKFQQVAAKQPSRTEAEERTERIAFPSDPNGLIGKMAQTLKGNESVYLLCHEDFNSANILVEPSTFNMTGIIDWEMICILPEWIALDYPEVLRDVDHMDDKEPPIPPSYEDEEDLAVLKRDR